MRVLAVIPAYKEEGRVGATVRDSQSGFRAIRAEVLRKRLAAIRFDGDGAGI